MNRQILVFDIATELARQDEYKNISVNLLNGYLTLAASATQGVADSDFIKLAESAGLNEKKARALKAEIEKEVSQSILKGSISTIFIKDALSAKSHELSASSKPTIDDIFESIGHCQTLYSMLTLSEPAAAIGAFWNNNQKDNKAGALVQELHRVFMKTSGPSTRARLSYVVDNVMGLVQGSKFINIEPTLPGVAYKVEDIGMFKDLGFGDFLAGHLLTTRMIQGIAPSFKGATMPLDKVVDNLVLGVGEILPFIPQGYIKVNEKQVTSLIEELWLYFVTLRCSTNDPGNMLGRYTNIMDTRKYKRDDNYDQPIQESIAMSSIVMESFLDTAALMKLMLESSDVYFPDVHPIVQAKLKEFYVASLKKQSETKLDFTHPRSLYEPAYLINHTIELKSVEPSFSYSDDAISRTKPILTDPETFSVTEYLRSPIKSGHYTTLGDIAKMRLFHFVPEAAPTYFMSLPNPSFIKEYSEFEKLLTIKRIDDLFLKTDIGEFLLDKSKVIRVSGVQDAINLFNVTPDMAKRIMKDGPGLFVQLGTLTESYFFWDFELAPIYEVAGGTESVHVQPFVAGWPAIAGDQLSGPEVDTIEIVNAKGTIEKIKTLEGKNKDLENAKLELEKKNEGLMKELEEAKKKGTPE